ncbi:MAG: flagellar motor switch protein FliM [Burkholderiales bacterium]
MNDVLTQDEVDSLFSDDDDATASAQPVGEAASADGVRRYDLGGQERTVRGRMPTLEIVHERFGRNVRVALFHFMHRQPELMVGATRAMKYSAFLRELVLPTNLNLVSLKTLRGNALVIIEPTLVFGIVETMFGGSGKVHSRVEGRDFTPTETRIIQKVLELMLEEYRSAWAPVFDLQVEYSRSEMQPQFVSIASPSELVVTCRFDLDLGHAQGAFHVCMPYSSLEPIRDLLASTGKADPAATDKRWVGLLSHQVQSAEVELVARLTSVQASLKQVLAMRPGDVLAIDVPEQVTASVDGIPLFQCRPGNLNGHYALRVEEVLNHARDFEKAGADNAR